MRVIGEVPHPVYKITILKMNDKVTIQIEDRLVTQSYGFRSGTGIKDVQSAANFLAPNMMATIDKRFAEMKEDYMNTLQAMNDDTLDDFEII